MTNADNARSFKIDLRQFAEEIVPEALLRVQKGVALDILRRLVLKSPVGNPSLWKRKAPKGYTGGTFRGFWQAYVAVDPGDGVPAPKRGTRPRTASLTQREAEQRIRSAKLGDTIYIVNGLPYATRLNAGWSKQAPSGFFELAVAETARKVAEDFRQ